MIYVFIIYYFGRYVIMEKMYFILFGCLASNAAYGFLYSGINNDLINLMEGNIDWYIIFFKIILLAIACWLDNYTGYVLPNYISLKLRKKYTFKNGVNMSYDVEKISDDLLTFLNTLIESVIYLTTMFVFIYSNSKKDFYIVFAIYSTITITNLIYQKTVYRLQSLSRKIYEKINKYSINLTRYQIMIYKIFGRAESGMNSLKLLLTLSVSFYAALVNNKLLLTYSFTSSGYLNMLIFSCNKLTSIFVSYKRIHEK